MGNGGFCGGFCGGLEGLGGQRGSLMPQLPGLRREQEGLGRIFGVFWGVLCGFCGGFVRFCEVLWGFWEERGSLDAAGAWTE